MLERLREHKVPVFVVHGGWDLAVPLQTAKDAARRARATSSSSEGQPLLAPQGPRDDAGDHARPHARPPRHRGAKAQLDAGVDPVDATDDEVEAALYEPDALVLELTPRQRHHDTEDLHRPPRYRWKVLAARSRGD